MMNQSKSAFTLGIISLLFAKFQLFGPLFFFLIHRHCLIFHIIITITCLKIVLSSQKIIQMNVVKFCFGFILVIIKH